jgi:hypothetical protein
VLLVSVLMYLLVLISFLMYSLLPLSLNFFLISSTCSGTFFRYFLVIPVLLYLYLLLIYLSFSQFITTKVAPFSSLLDFSFIYLIDLFVNSKECVCVCVWHNMQVGGAL